MGLPVRGSRGLRRVAPMSMATGSSLDRAAEFDMLGRCPASLIGIVSRSAAAARGVSLCNTRQFTDIGSAQLKLGS